MKTCHPDALALRICYTGAGRKRFGPFLTSHLDPREPLMRTLSLLLSVAFLASASAAAATDFDIAAGKFKPAWESLESQYQCPDWFRDAKFGIWAHWGPQCQPEQGDWYAAEHVHVQLGPIQVPGRALRPSVEVRFQGRHSHLEGRELRPRQAHRPVQAGRRQVLRRNGQPPLQLRYLQLEISAVELRGHRSQAGPCRQLGRGRAEGRPALRRDRACGPLVDLVRSGPGRRPERSAGRHSL